MKKNQIPVGACFSSKNMDGAWYREGRADKSEPYTCHKYDKDGCYVSGSTRPIGSLPDIDTWYLSDRSGVPIEKAKVVTKEEAFDNAINGMKEFVERVEKGEVKSTYTYHTFKRLIEEASYHLVFDVEEAQKLHKKGVKLEFNDASKENPNDIWVSYGRWFHKPLTDTGFKHIKFRLWRKK